MSAATLEISSSRTVLQNYLAEAPFPLAHERSWECKILAQQSFQQPVLDVGCGEGLFVKMLFDGEVDTGIDPNPKELRRAHQLGGYKELIQCAGDSIPRPDASFQTIFSNSVLEHIPDLVPVLRELHRLLASDGCLYVTVPSNLFDHYSVVNQLLTGLGFRSAAAKYRAFFNRFWHHYHFYKPVQWQDLFRSVGFEVRECFSYGPKKLCVLNDFLVPFSLPCMLLKKLMNRWTLFPSARRAVLSRIAAWVESAGPREIRTPEGGLVFLALTKKRAVAA